MSANNRRSPAARKTALRVFWVTSSVVVIGFACLLAGCASIGERYVFAGGAHQGNADTIVQTNSSYELLSLKTRDGTKLSALFGLALDPEGRPLSDVEHRPTFLFFYGNGSCLHSFQGVFDRLRRTGANVLIPEYPGYGMSEGHASEAAFYATADAAYDYLLKRSEIDPDHIIVAGYSIGGAVAIDFASRKKVAGLVTISTFTSIRDMARRAPWSMRWAVPFVTTRTKFNSLAKIEKVTCPVLIAHGTDDVFVPPEMASRLADAATKSKGKGTCLFEEGDHGGILNNQDLWKALTEWVH